MRYFHRKQLKTAFYFCFKLIQNSEKIICYYILRGGGYALLFGVRIYCFEMSLNTQYFEKIILKHLRLQPAAFYKTALILEVSRRLKKRHGFVRAHLSQKEPQTKKGGPGLRGHIFHRKSRKLKKAAC